MGAIVFGKLPAHGDFVARGVSGQVRAALDDWLSASFAQAQAVYGDTFTDRFDQAQPWRCSGDGVVGAIAASQDGAGRRFPLLVLARGEQSLADMAEDHLYAAITEGWDADRLAQVAGTAPVGPVDRWYRADRSLTGAMPLELLREMLA